MAQTQGKPLYGTGPPRGPNIDDVLPLAIEWAFCFAWFFLTPGLLCVMYGATKSYHVPPDDGSTNTTDPVKFKDDDETFLPPHIEAKRLNMLNFGIATTVIGFLFLFAMIGMCVYRQMRRKTARKAYLEAERLNPTATRDSKGNNDDVKIDVGRRSDTAPGEGEHVE
jgi:hypothetical protein